MNSFQDRLANRAFQGVRRVCGKCNGTCKSAETSAACSECGGVGFNTIKEKGSSVKRVLLAVALVCIAAVSGCVSEHCKCKCCADGCKCVQCKCDAGCKCKCCK